MRRLAVALTALFVVLLPLGWPGLPWNMQLGDVMFPLVCVAAIAAGWRTRAHRLDLFVAAVLLGSLASVPASHAPAASMLGLAKQVYVSAIYLVIATAASEIGADRLCEWWTQSVVAICLVTASAAAVFYATGIAWRPLGDPGELPYVGMVFRVWGLAMGPELFGCALTFTVPLIVLGPLPPSRKAAVAALLIALEAMTFSLSLAGFAAALTIAVWPLLRNRPVSRVLLASGALALVIVINVAAVFAFRQIDITHGKNPSLGPPPYPYVRQNAETRADMMDVRISYYPMSYYIIKKVAWSAFVEHPLTGIGLEAFPTETERAYNDGTLYSPYQRVAPHSTYFGRLAETGLVGTLTLVALLTAILVYGIRAARMSGSDRLFHLAWALAAGCAGLMVSGVNVDIMNFRFFWFGAGIIRALQQTSRR